ncbi:DUF488 domain-containing protein [Sandaracinobacter sp. RS1-74]|uniref:DUF488 domain-containing protein n=1 Tax=Sandaracinobacteroides sayramensis TaxID=2913411 RepID=UPI001EDBC8DE|nr:DUF488 domain-containing protein [Sandaracinobacteroides sayramensis]MCG2839419.1 DUF488 domain-containing protein [Sandaracinobacteroides sayramensis]
MKPADLRIKRIYASPGAEDGQRVLVDRLWPRGVSKAKAELTLWLKEIAPSPDLRKWFEHQPDRFAAFSADYRAELAANPEAVARLRALIDRGPVTLLYAARDPQCNHALVLQAYMRETS